MSSYRWNSEEYRQHSTGQQDWGRELIRKLHLQGTEQVLDIGCGDGRITAEIAKILTTGSITGIDSSPQMIGLAKKQFPSDQYGNLSFEIMDGSCLIFREQFDIVFSNAALHWVTDHKPVLAGIYKSLKPGGKILLQMGGKGNAEKILTIIDTFKTISSWSSYLSNIEFPYGFFSAETYKKLLTDAGFSVNRVELIPKDMKHKGQSGLEGWIRTTWMPYTNRIPENERETFIKNVATQYLEQEPLDTQGNAHVSMIRLEVEAGKTI